MLTFTKLLRDPIPDHEQKQVALTYLHEAWAEAHLDGVDGDCMAQACLFRALSELIGTYGEEATAHFTEADQERRILAAPTTAVIAIMRCRLTSPKTVLTRLARLSQGFPPTSPGVRGSRYRPANR